MKKRLAALLFCLALLFQAMIPSAYALRSIYFTAAGNEVLPLEDGKMPLWYNGYLYLPSTMFTGRVNRSLDVAYLPNTAAGVRILYGGGESIRFELGKGYAHDTEGRNYYPGAIQRGSEIYVPAAVVAAFFNLEYSVTSLTNPSITNGNYGALVWIRKPDFGLSDREFANAATYQMADRYSKYEESLREPEGGDPGGEEPPEALENGKNVYLCLEAGASSAALLDALDAYGAKGAFFCTLSFLEDQGPLLRRMAAGGHAVGLLAEAGERPIPEQLEEGNEALARATLGKTRLAFLRGGDGEARQAAEDAGFRCLSVDVDRSGYDLRNTEQAENLLRRVSAQRGDVKIWLADRAGAIGLRAFLAIAGEAEDRCLALTETTP